MFQSEILSMKQICHRALDLCIDKGMEKLHTIHFECQFWMFMTRINQINSFWKFTFVLKNTFSLWKIPFVLWKSPYSNISMPFLNNPFFSSAVNLLAIIGIIWHIFYRASKGDIRNIGQPWCFCWLFEYRLFIKSFLSPTFMAVANEKFTARPDLLRRSITIHQLFSLWRLTQK